MDVDPYPFFDREKIFFTVRAWSGIWMKHDLSSDNFSQAGPFEVNFLLEALSLLACQADLSRSDFSADS